VACIAEPFAILEVIDPPGNPPFVIRALFATFFAVLPLVGYAGAVLRKRARDRNPATRRETAVEPDISSQGLVVIFAGGRREPYNWENPSFNMRLTEVSEPLKGATNHWLVIEGRAIALGGAEYAALRTAASNANLQTKQSERRGRKQSFVNTVYTPAGPLTDEKPPSS
jgi:hypothetical protein